MNSNNNDNNNNNENKFNNSNNDENELLLDSEFVQNTISSSPPKTKIRIDNVHFAASKKQIKQEKLKEYLEFSETQEFKDFFKPYPTSGNKDGYMKAFDPENVDEWKPILGLFIIMFG